MADPRLTAVGNVLAVLDGRSLDRVLSDASASPAATDERDRALAAELSYGVCRWYRRLDALIALLLQKPFKPRDRDRSCPTQVVRAPTGSSPESRPSL